MKTWKIYLNWRHLHPCPRPCWHGCSELRYDIRTPHIAKNPLIMCKIIFSLRVFQGGMECRYEIEGSSGSNIEVEGGTRQSRITSQGYAPPWAAIRASFMNRSLGCSRSKEACLQFRRTPLPASIHPLQQCCGRFSNVTIAPGMLR